MAPIAVEPESLSTIGNGGIPNKAQAAQTLQREPMRTSGLLDENKFFESTVIIGREYPDVQLADLMKSSERDQYIRDLAITGRQLI